MTACCGRAQPGGFPRWARQSAIKAHRTLCHNERLAGDDPFVEGVVQLRAFSFQNSAGDFDSSRAQQVDAASVMLRVGINAADNDAASPSLDNVVDARRGATVRRTRLKRDIKSS